MAERLGQDEASGALAGPRLPPGELSDLGRPDAGQEPARDRRQGPLYRGARARPPRRRYRRRGAFPQGPSRRESSGTRSGRDPRARRSPRRLRLGEIRDPVGAAAGSESGHLQPEARSAASDPPSRPQARIAARQRRHEDRQGDGRGVRRDHSRRRRNHAPGPGGLHTLVSRVRLHASRARSGRARHPMPLTRRCDPGPAGPSTTGGPGTR